MLGLNKSRVALSDADKFRFMTVIPACDGAW